MNVSILHIADLHISKKKLHDIKIVREKLLLDLVNMQKKEGLNIDFIVFSGDIINKGENSKVEYPLAYEEFIKPLLNHLGRSLNDIFLVPGNHDVDRKKTSKNFEDGLASNLNDLDSLNTFFDSFGENKGEEAFLKRKLDGYSTLCDKVLKNKNLVERNFFFDIYKIKVAKIDVGIIALNSAWRSSGFGDDDRRLLIGARVVEKASTFIKDCDLKLAISHHPLDMLTTWDQKTTKNTLAQNVNIFFTGHLHDSDFTYEKPILGKLYVSTCGAIFQGRIINGYSILNLDLSHKKMTVYLRRWYERRGEFDQETEKCANGKIDYENFVLENSSTSNLIEINNIKEELLNNHDDDSTFLVPIEDLSLKIKDVFVEPMLSDNSIYNKSNQSRKYFKISEILEKNNNIVFFGRKEFGKTTLLEYIGDIILRDESNYEDKIPIYLNFADLPPYNYKSISRLVLGKMHTKCTAEYVDMCLKTGNFVILIDDYDNPSLKDREKKRQCLNEFILTYPHCHYLITINENISLFYNNIYAGLIKQLNADFYYLLPFNAGKIRELLKKWSLYKNFNINEMLNNILYFFQQLQIPVTPMNVTLFIGVLFRDKNKKNIKNEAYLIENYLETILEKLQDAKVENEFDFREKESFLSHIAITMAKKNQLEMTDREFEDECTKYFDFLDEDQPEKSFYDDFFKKGIFQKIDGKMSFKFKFWFHFFIAKAMQNNVDYKNYILDDKYYLKYSTALAYKAGLDRNDNDLLNTISERLVKNIEPIAKGNSHKKFTEYEIEDALIEYTKEVENEIKEKSTSDEIDKRRDEKYLAYDDEDQGLISSDNDEELDLVELVTLYSDIIRNTREISADQKQTHLRISINSYLALMWESLESFKLFIESLDKVDMKKFLFNSSFSLKKKIEISDTELNKISKRIKEYILTIIPISIILYMADHLSNNKLSRTLISLIEVEKNINAQLFYALLLLKMNIEKALKYLKDIINDSDSYIIDRIVFDYLINYCLENEVTEKDFNNITEILQIIREKYSKKVKQKDKKIYIKDTFISDLEAKINLIKFKKS